MSNFEKEMYALQDKDGNLIGIDYQSGGYPWEMFVCENSNALLFEISF